MLEVENLRVMANTTKLLELDHMSVSPGEFCAIAGANGAGKSTLLKCLSGDISYQGDICLHGRPLSSWKRRERACHVAVVPQQITLSFSFTAWEVVELGLTPLSLSRDQSLRLMKNTMDMLNCLHLADKPYPQLSGGEQQRVNLSRVFVQLAQAERPPLLLLDEALSAQDLGQQHALLERIRDYLQSKQAMVIGVLHDLNHVLRYCDTSVLLEHGQCIDQGSVEDVLNQEQIHRCWAYTPEIISTKSGHRVLV
jgi:iron complex transport system ATP-binding protein